MGGALTAGPDRSTAGSGARPFLGGRLRLGQAALVGAYADVLLALASLAIVPFLIHRLGAEPYGILGIVSVLGGQLGIFHFGVGTAATRLVSESVGRGGEDLTPRLTGVLIVSAVASLLMGGAFVLAAPILWRGGFDVSPAALPVALAAVPAGAAVIALSPASAAVTGVLTAQERFLFSAALRVYGGVGRLLGAVVVVVLGGGVVGVLWIQAAFDLTYVLLGWVRSYGGAGPLAEIVRPSSAVRDAAVAVFAVGTPFALVSVLSALLTDAEKLAVGLAGSVEDFTYYTVPFNAVVRFAALAGAVVRVLTPRVTALCARGEMEEAMRLTERADRLLATLVLGALAPVVAVLPELLRFWVGEPFVEHSTLSTRILLLGIAVNTLAFPAFALVLGRARPAYLNAIYAAEVVLHLAVVYVLVRNFGIVGAATAWTIRVLVDTLAQRTLAVRTAGVGFADGPYVWGTVAVLGALVAAAPFLALTARVALGTVVAVGCLVRLLRGGEGDAMLDSVLPWRWGKGGVA